MELKLWRRDSGKRRFAAEIATILLELLLVPSTDEAIKRRRESIWNCCAPMKTSDQIKRAGAAIYRQDRPPHHKLCEMAQAVTDWRRTGRFRLDIRT